MVKKLIEGMLVISFWLFLMSAESLVDYLIVNLGI